MQFGQYDMPNDPVRQACMFAQWKCHVLEHVYISQERSVLKKHAEAAAQYVQLLYAELRNIDSLNENGATIGNQLTGPIIAVTLPRGIDIFRPLNI
jgi:hypothetical protein